MSEATVVFLMCKCCKGHSSSVFFVVVEVERGLFLKNGSNLCFCKVMDFSSFADSWNGRNEDVGEKHTINSNEGI